MADTRDSDGRSSTPRPADGLLRVALVEDKRDLRESLSALIGGSPGFQCSGAYRSMEEALPALDHDTPHVVLLDIGLPGMSGIEGARILKQRYPTELAILALTVYDDDAKIFDALCAGAAGYLLRDTPPARLLECLREVSEGGAPMSPLVARRVLALFRTVRPPDRVDYDLTPHELRLLRLLVDGHSYKTAGVQLGVSVNTIAFHVKHIYDKLQVHSKSEAVAKALRNRLV